MLNLTVNAMPADPPRQWASVLGVCIDIGDRAQTVARISAWARSRESRVVCICNTHSVVTAAQQPSFMQVLQRADLATPDGAPVAWMLRRQGAVQQQRVSGPDLMLDYCAHAEATGESIFLLGSSPDTLARLQAELLRHWPGLRIAGALSPPYRPASAEEDAAVVLAINQSGAGTVWVSLGCPKQEQWMDAHRGRVQAVMIGVGAAFGFHAGTTPRAPPWMRDHGLEWLHRLASEPRRLWKRYTVTGSAFIVLAARQLLSRSKD